MPPASPCSGYAFRKLGKWSSAIADYLQSLALAPGNVKTYNNLGYSYAKGGDYENAIKSYTTVSGTKGMGSTLPSWRMQNSRDLCERVRASCAHPASLHCAQLAALQVIEIDPSNSHAYHNRGISYDKLAQFELAIADFSKGAVAPALLWPQACTAGRGGDRCMCTACVRCTGVGVCNCMHRVLTL